MFWVFQGLGYAMGIYGVWLWYVRDVVMSWVFKGCGYVMVI